ncbi:patatin-like phospholipase family protein [Nocardioides sp. HM23]|uniref:patatin-like phospholipase family protein n=1 Tax=Nocardioides bizhenqiangii TaxID=3095076 RepID=UPI002ACAF9EE|nr:patatin-like phospholipase family protein [Nocardioides sp. HM23]MDZ5622043.1 patatin-like phospholipase family protein [Nocardioides sp. HM23]
MSDPHASEQLPECDVIMKGGISSGIVYPRAVVHLSGRYRFRRLGGTSAGAIAAVAAAAAEHGRESGGFTKLNGLPDDLGRDMKHLFQPTSATRSVFHLALDWLEPKWGLPTKLLSTVRRLVAGAPVVFALVLFVFLLLGSFLVWTPAELPDDFLRWVLFVVGAATWMLVSLVIALAAAGAWMLFRTLKTLPKQGFGICDGHTRDKGAAVPPLTDWMHEQFQDLAGRTTDEAPLTFGNLWGEEAVKAFQELRGKDGVLPRQWREVAALRRIDLEVMTTNVTLGRPYLFPFRERIFYFCAEDLKSYFPKAVVDHLVDTSEEAEDQTRDDENGRPVVIAMKCPRHNLQVRSLPEPQDLPVLMAARISLSFPILLSALPLFCVDWARGPGKQGLIQTWFSDGGISSNFPMHLFDSPLPSRPTFGFNLGPAHPDYPDLVWAPREQGRSGSLPRSQGIASVPNFLRAVLGAMQNWGDNTRITMPGFRDRVAIIRQKDGEGGLNLAMPPEVIKELADRGAEAAGLFDDFDLDLHKWVRYRVSMAATDELLATLCTGYDGGFGDYLATYRPKTTRFKPAARDGEATDAVIATARVLADAKHPHTGGSVPRPVPDLRVTPRL